MGDIQKAYEVLNRTLKLGLTKEQLFRAEANVKFDHSDRMKFKPELRKDPAQFLADWEFQTILVPRSRPISDAAKASMRAGAQDVAKSRSKPT